jgi:hypothetical protein
MLTILWVIFFFIALYFWNGRRIGDFEGCSNKDGRIGWVFMILSLCVWITDLLM